MTVYATGPAAKTLPLGKIPATVDDADASLYTQAASEMIEARLGRTWASAWPQRVTDATVILATRIYNASVDSYKPTGGNAELGYNPTPALLWDRVIDDLLYGLAPEGTGVGAGAGGGLPHGGDLTRTAPIVSPTWWPDANDSIYRGDPNAPYGGRRLA